MRRISILLGVLIILFLVGLVWWKRGISAADTNNRTPKIFIIDQGQGVREIAKNLKEEGLIKDQIVFFLLTKQMGLDQKIQAGDYRLFPSMTADQIAKELTHGTLDIWVTIPEGQRAGQIAEALKDKMPEYQESWDQELEDNEGYLFPDTYLFPKESDIDTIISIMKGNFESKYQTIDSKGSGLSKEELVTLASLIEREAKHDQDRAMVASVIHNRLSQGMKLDIDATIQYAQGKVNGKWWTPITQDDYTMNSPYNTYLINGLPPGPISNPGLSSLQAAANPSETDYLYYITDKNGINRYGKSFAEHQANIKKYGL